MSPKKSRHQNHRPSEPALSNDYSAANDPERPATDRADGHESTDAPEKRGWWGADEETGSQPKKTAVWGGANNAGSGAFGKDELPGFEMKTVATGVKVVFSLLGLALGVLGLIGTIVAFFVISNVLSDTQTLVLAQIDTTIATVDGASNSLDAMTTAVELLPNTTAQTKVALVAFSNSTSRTADSLDALAGSLNSLSGLITIPGATTGSLTSAAGDLRTGSAALANVSRQLDGITASTTDAAVGLRQAQTGMSQAHQNLLTAKSSIKKIFGNLSLFLLIMTAVLCFMFLALIAYSIPVML